MPSKSWQSDSGSAVAEFVLVLAPCLVVFNLLLTVVAGSLLQTSTVALAARLAEICGLADFEPNEVLSQAKLMAPPWLRTVQATCSTSAALSEVSLSTALKAPLSSIETKVIWHAASEISR